jgi:hypothetical protein
VKLLRAEKEERKSTGWVVGMVGRGRLTYNSGISVFNRSAIG